MTVYKTLATQTLENGVTVKALECWDKFCAAPRYEVTVCRDGVTVRIGDEHPCARTTWRRKFQQMIAEEANR